MSTTRASQDQRKTVQLKQPHAHSHVYSLTGHSKSSKRSVMDVAHMEAEAQLNGFLDRQAAKVGEDRAVQEHANALEAFWRDSECRHTERRGRANRALWFEFFCRQAESHRKLSEDYEARAEALCQEGDAA